MNHQNEVQAAAMSAIEKAPKAEKLFNVYKLGLFGEAEGQFCLPL